MMDAFSKTLLKCFAEIGKEIMQKASYELGDMLNSKDPLERLFYLAQMRLVSNCVAATLDERERKIIDFIVDHSELTILPEEFDDRKKQDAGADCRGADGASQ